LSFPIHVSIDRGCEGSTGRNIFGTKEKDATRRWRISYEDELHNLYASSNTIMGIKFGKMKQADA
jgi:hypothetical protein